MWLSLQYTHCLALRASLLPGELDLVEVLHEVLVMPGLCDLFSPFNATVAQEDQKVAMILEHLQGLPVFPMNQLAITFYQGLEVVNGNPLVGLILGDPPVAIFHPCFSLRPSGWRRFRLLCPFDFWGCLCVCA